MRVLIINDRLIAGGTEVQSLREMDILNKNEDACFMLTFDKKFPKNHKKYNANNGYYNISLSNRGLSKLYRKLFCDYFLLKKIKAIIEEIKPDIIHLNNCNFAAITQYISTKGYKTVQTIRDYGAICYKFTCIYNNNLVCDGYKNEKCLSKCGNYKIANLLKIYKLNKALKIKKKNIKAFITPSEKLKSYCLDNDYKNVYCINDCLDIKNIKVNKNIDFYNKTYLYYGSISYIKGVFNFVTAFKKFSKDKSVNLIIAGNGKKDDIERLNKIIANEAKIKYLGFMNYSYVFAVVVPSIWMENYPNTVLEGMAYSCLIVGSNRGGIPEMLNNNGFIFDPLDEDNFINALENSYNISFQEYTRLIENGRISVKVRNSEEMYYKGLIKLFNKV